MTHEIVQGDCLEVMRTYPDNHFSAVVTDPPYGLHFMGKDWDRYAKGKVKAGRKILGTHTNSEAHEVARYDDRRNDEFEAFIYEVGRELLRIVKPGGHLLMFGAPRRFHRQICAIEDAGFEIRDCLMWLFGSGFPKSHNHFGLEGFGTALKPAYEPIIMAMKPLDGTFAQNAEKWGQAGINIDGCRIGTDDTRCMAGLSALGQNSGWNKHTNRKMITGSEKGRWPANVLLDEEAAKQLGEPSRFFYCAKTSSKERNEGLDEFPAIDSGHQYGYAPSEGRNVARGETPKRNNHPTVKPLALMRYLLTLVAPPKDALILDPFAGSGSTVCAAKQLGIDCIGIEKQPEYCEIARARAVHYEPESAEDSQLKFA